MLLMQRQAFGPRQRDGSNAQSWGEYVGRVSTT